MTYLQLIKEVGHADLISMFLQNKISKLSLAQETGNSNVDLVIQYKLNRITAK